MAARAWDLAIRKMKPLVLLHWTWKKDLLLDDKNCMKDMVSWGTMEEDKSGSESKLMAAETEAGTP
ncbi:unnamed protein product [Dovyalis caffra]|uniref:Uncharacterized protein n=1 Tax=Dovyalis caffra TaxID=77055 RepID=A0AAV1SNE8_9ROSI|nr:unnamed protein product [Dovyalis caffra]